MTALTQALSTALIHFVWQGIIVGFALWAVLGALRNSSPGLRYALSCAALAALAIAPAITTAVVYEGAASSGFSFVNVQEDIPNTTANAHAPLNSAGTNWLAPIQLWMLPIWSIGVLLFSVRLVWGCTHAFSLGRHGDPADAVLAARVADLAKRMGIDRPIRVLISKVAEVPSVIGWLRPVVLLPAASLMGLTAIQLEAVLAHELAHIRRLDYLVNILQMVAETLFFYHPAVWWTSKRIRLERELCCDDLAVRSCGDALSYARALTTLEKLRLSPPSLAMASTGGPLLYRIQRLMGVKAQEHRKSRASAWIAIALALVCVALSANWQRSQAQTRVISGVAGELAKHEESPDSPGVQVDLQSSAVIHRTPVEYPESLAKKGVKGTVQAEVTLDANGNVSDARVLSGPEELRKAVLQSLLNWHFTRDSGGRTRLVSVVFDPAKYSADNDRRFELEARAVTIESEKGGPGFRFRLVGPANTEEQKKEGAVIGKEDELRAQQQALRAQLQEVEVQARNEKTTDFLNQRIQELKMEIEASTKVLREREWADRAGKEQLEATVKTRELELAKIDADRRRRAEIASRLEAEQSRIDGRVLKSITTEGLPESVRTELLPRLPVRVGDTIREEQLRAVDRIVSEYDEHLEGSFRRSGDDLELRIILRGSAGRGYIFVQRPE